MAFLPVVTREMGVLARRQSTYWSRAVTATIAVLTMVWLLLVSSSQIAFAALGSQIFLVLSGFCFAFALLIGVPATSDCVSEEKREGTLGLLFLTDLRSIHIIASKMAARSLNSVFAVLGVVPMLALSLLLGGVTLAQVGQVALVLLSSMLLSLSLGVFVSTVSKNERKAMFACFVALLGVAVFPFVLSFAISDFDRIYSELVFVSPIYSFICTQGPAGTGFDPRLFVPSIIFQVALAFVLLLAASHVLPRYIDELPSRRFLRARAWIDSYVYGRREQRRKYRAELLDRNAFMWLASRERVKPKYAWVVVCFFAVLFTWVGLQFTNMFFDPAVALTIIFLVHFVLKIWVASEVCSRLINDRRSGALELLLSSPLSVHEITHGQTLALRRIFARPVTALVIGEIVLLILTLRERTGEAARVDTVLLYCAGITTLLLDLWALKWVGMWLSLFGKSIERVLVATQARVLALPWVVFILTGGTLGTVVALQNDRLPPWFMYAFWWFWSVLLSSGFGIAARNNTLKHFREIATQQLTVAAFRRRPREKRERALRARFWPELRSAMRRHWFLTSASTAVGLVVLFCGARQFYWNGQLKAELAKIRAAKLPASAAEIGKIYPILPANEDAFAHLRSAGTVNWGRWPQLTTGPQLLAQMKAERAEVFADCEKILQRNQAQLVALKELLKYDKGYVDPFAENRWAWSADTVAYFALASADLVRSLDTRDSAAVERDLEVLLKFAELFRAQPIVFFQEAANQVLVAFSIGLETAFSRDLLQGKQVLRLQSRLEAVAQQPALPRLLAVERACLIEAWSRIPDRFGGPPSVLLAAAQGLFTLVGSNDRALVHALRSYDAALQLQSDSRTRSLKDPVLTAAPGPMTFALIAAGPGQPQLSTIFYSDTGFLQRIALLRLALATERYRCARGGLPSALTALVPTFIDQLPRDPFQDEQFDLVRSDGQLTVRAPIGGQSGITAPPNVAFTFKVKTGEGAPLP